MTSWLSGPPRELKWRNHYMHTIPLIATATRESADALIALCKADLESTSPCNKLTKLRAPGKPKQLFLLLSLPVVSRKRKISDEVHKDMLADLENEFAQARRARAEAEIFRCNDKVESKFAERK